MTNSASQATRAPFEHSLGIIRQASIEILLLLGIHTTEGKEPRWFMEQLEQARLNLGGWGAVAKKLRINDAQLSQFMLQLRHLQQHVPQYDSGQEVSEINSLPRCVLSPRWTSTSAAAATDVSN